MCIIKQPQCAVPLERRCIQVRRSIQSIEQMVERIAGAVSEGEHYGVDGYRGANSECVRMTRTVLQNLQGRFRDFGA
jgi:hypothetical protein